MRKLKEGRVRKGQIIECPICHKNFIAKYKGTIRCCSKECTATLKSIKIKDFYKINPKSKKEKLTYLEKTGYTHPLLNPEHRQIIVSKIKATKLERYRDENYNNKEQIEKTNLERYGEKYSGGLNIFLKKAKQTKLEKYGDENYNNKEQAKQTCLKKYGTENVKLKIKNTCLKKYGVTNPAKSKKIQEKMSRTYKEKTGYDHPSQNPEIKIKKIKTMNNNNSHNASSDEKIIFTMLKSKFDNVIDQYYSEKYPFKCDFYIPSLNLYIEYQGTWKHGKANKNVIYGPYDPNNDLHKKVLANWKKLANSGSNQYKSAIHVWTISDPLKREIAKKNNLNWIEFFTIQEIKEWLKSV